MAFEVLSLTDYQSGSFGQDGEAVPTNSKNIFNVVGGYSTEGGTETFKVMSFATNGGANVSILPSVAEIDQHNVAFVTAEGTSGTEVVVGSAAGSTYYITDISISTDTEINYTLKGGTNTLIAPKYVPANSVWSKSYQTPLPVGSELNLLLTTSATANLTIDVNGYYL